MFHKKLYASLVAGVVLTGCATSGIGDFSSQDIQKMMQEFEGRVSAQRDAYPGYPRVGTTYMSFSPDHGFQVTYYESESRSWLWYGGNDIALPAEWKLEKKDVDETGAHQLAGDQTLICWKYGANTYNSSTVTTGGKFQCTALVNALQVTVSSLDGDPFNLSSGAVPYVREKCDAPDEFVIQTDTTLYSNVGIEDCM
ncbi:hypothetical protein [Hyphomonas beringensis]|nr:hypothetical protein [Hyphomonas beringensis]